MSRLLVLGESPSRTARTFASAGARSGRRFEALVPGFWDQAEAANVLGRRPASSGKGRHFDAGAARRRLARLRRSVEGKDVLVASVRAARALGASRAILTWAPAPPDGPLRLAARVAVIPHPSGVVRWWNDPANVRRAAAFLREAAGSRD